MKSKGQGFGGYGLFILVEVAAVIILIMLVDNTIRTDVLTIPASQGLNMSTWNQTVNTTTMTYGAFPWIFIFCAFGALLLYVLSRRGG